MRRRKNLSESERRLLRKIAVRAALTGAYDHPAFCSGEAPERVAEWHLTQVHQQYPIKLRALRDADEATFIDAIREYLRRFSLIDGAEMREGEQ